MNQEPEKIKPDEEVQSISHVQSHDNNLGGHDKLKPEPESDVNPDSHGNQESLLQKFQQLCKFWHPILGTGAAIVSLLVTLSQIL